MSYSSNFNLGNRWALTPRKGKALDGGFGVGYFNDTYDAVEQDPVAAAAAQARSQALDAIMAGLDNNSNEFADKLKSIYDGYGKYAKEYGDKAQPIMDALTGDISGMEGYIKNYGSTLAEIKDTMLNGIQVDPTSTNTREQYQGAVASAYGKNEEQQKQAMESQGLNPYANTGATRQNDLSRTAAMTNADNQAYSDWRTQYNKDMQAKGELAGAYAGLVGKQADMQGQLFTGRGLLLEGQKGIYDANLGARKDTAAGYENLMSVNEQRRQEQLALAQQAQAQANLDNDLKQQQEAKLSPKDLRYKADPNW